MFTQSSNSTLRQPAIKQRGRTRLHALGYCRGEYLQYALGQSVLVPQEYLPVFGKFQTVLQERLSVSELSVPARSTRQERLRL